MKGIMRRRVMEEKEEGHSNKVSYTYAYTYHNFPQYKKYNVQEAAEFPALKDLLSLFH